jgi:flagellar biosynthesis/type III secretory pathway M-ring protein FliF/YscJ
MYSDTTKRLISFPKCRSVEVINNSAKPGSNHWEVNCINYKNSNTITTIIIVIIIILILLLLLLLLLIIIKKKKKKKKKLMRTLRWKINMRIKQ